MTRRCGWSLLFLLIVLWGAWVVGERAAPQATGAAEIIGLVRDEQGPVSGARVRCRGQATLAFTDSAGVFRLPRSSGRVTASAPHHFIGGVAADSRPLIVSLKSLPADDDVDYAWVDPRHSRGSAGNCGNCHGEILREWSASAHARIGRHFRNLYDDLLDERPLAAGVCAACHAPTATLDETLDLRTARNVTAQGVHCDFCHKVADAGLGEIGLTHGRFGMQLLRPSKDQVFFGPLDDVDRGEDVYAPIYRSSRYCASCHEGTVLGVAVYTTYSEWLASPAGQQGKQCQTCHMKPTGTMHNIAPGNGGIDRDPRTLANHRFFAGSLEDMLRRSVSVAVNVGQVAEGKRVLVTMRATDVGHRVPTGFVDRHLLLVVEGFTASGEPIAPLRGRTLPALAGKGFAGLPGRLHAKLLQDEQGRLPASFWLTARVVDDTRLRPEQADESEFVFSPALTRLRVRVLYRRFWQEIADRKQWPDNEIVVLDRSIDIGS